MTDNGSLPRMCTTALSVPCFAAILACNVVTPSTAAEVGVDESSNALTTTNETYKEVLFWADPITSAEDLGGSPPSGYQCGQSSYGTCPKKTVACTGGLVVSINLIYDGDGNGQPCKDGSNTPVQGTVSLTRNGVRDWTVTLSQLQRGSIVTADGGTGASGSTFNGSVTFTKQVGQSAWSVAMSALSVAGTQSGESEDTSCTASCVRRQVYRATVAVTMGTSTPLTLDATLTGQKKLVLGGTVLVTGTVAAHVEVWTKGAAGNDRNPVNRDINTTFASKTVTLSGVTYNLPFACTCPTAGSITTSSIVSFENVSCGDTVVTFSPSTAQGQCATTSVVYKVNGQPNTDLRCSYTADVASLALNDICVPLQ